MKTHFDIRTVYNPYFTIFAIIGKGWSYSKTASARKHITDSHYRALVRTIGHKSYSHDKDLLLHVTCAMISYSAADKFVMLEVVSKRLQSRARKLTEPISKVYITWIKKTRGIENIILHFRPYDYNLKFRSKFSILVFRFGHLSKKISRHMLNYSSLWWCVKQQ